MIPGRKVWASSQLPGAPLAYRPLAFDERLGAAVAGALTHVVGRPVSVAPPGSGGKPWYVSRLTGYPQNLCYSLPLGRRAYLYLADSVSSFSSRAWKRPMKRAAIAAQHRVSKPYRRLSTAVFETLADGSIGENLLILPCNRVVRVMDFDQDATTVCIRPGFSAEFMLKDIALRSDDQQAPFHKILAFSDDGSWLQEELVDGRPLFRATRDPDALGRWMLETLAVLETWQTASARRVDARCYVNALVNRIQAGFQESRAATRCALSTLPNGLLGSAKKAAASSPELLLVQGHRDLSPKNVIIRRDTGRPVILDWELSDESFQYFDRMCLGLGALDLLPEPGLELRLQRFLSARDDNEFLRALPTDGAWRALAGGVFALELVCWLLHMMDDYSGAYATELEACLNSLHRVDWAKG